MSDDDLIERLRDCSSDEAMWSRQAADRIEALIAERDAAEDRAVRQESAMETLRPVWAQGWTGESMAAQASATALAQLWQMLGASNQTEAVIALRAALACVKGVV